MRIRWKWVWWAVVGVAWLAAFFGIVSLPKDWNSTLSWLAPAEQWWAVHTAHPTLAAFVTGLAVATVLLPELWSQIYPHLFPPKPKADIAGAAAIERILTRSKWAKKLVKNGQLTNKLMYESHLTANGIIEGRLQLRLMKELHDLLRAGDLIAWGTPDNRQPYQDIKPQEWSDLEIDTSDLERYQTHGVHAIARRNQSSGLRYGYVWIKFCRKQIDREFPLAYWPRRISNESQRKTIRQRKNLTSSCRQWSPNPHLRKSLQKKLEHQSRLTAQVMAILELAQVKLQVLLRNPNVSPVDPALHLAPERLD